MAAMMLGIMLGGEGPGKEAGVHETETLTSIPEVFQDLTGTV